MRHESQQKGRGKLMSNLYARFVLFLIRPAISLDQKSRRIKVSIKSSGATQYLARRKE